MSLFHFGIIAVLLVFVAWKWRKLDLPGPTHYPILGAFSLVSNASRAHLFLAEECSRYGWKTFGMRILGNIFIVVIDPKNIEYLMNGNFDNFEKSAKSHEEFLDLFGENGIFGVNGEVWRKQRKVASHMFSQRMLTFMHERFKHHGDALFQILETSNKQIVDVQSLLFRFTFDAICDIAFGMEVNTLSQPKNAFAIAFERMNVLVMKRGLDPLWKVKRFLNLGTEKEMQYHKKIYDEYVYSVVDQVLRKRGYTNLDNLDNQDKKQQQHEDHDGDEGEQGFDVLSLFLTKFHARGEALDRPYLRDLISSFIIAGRDTTAWTLTAMMMVVSQDEQLERELLEEFKLIPLDEPVDQNSTAFPSFNAIKSAPFLKAVIYETLRLYPPVPVDYKSAIEDCRLPDGTYVPANAKVLYPPWLAGRNPAMWKDAERFDPKRWLRPTETGEEFLKVTEYEFPAWNAGPRICLGKEMSILEVATLFVPLLSKFKFRLANPQWKPEYVVGATIQLTNLNMTVERRL